jgi:hypothetical protein
VRIDGPKYSVWRARGNLTVRQQRANAAGCVAYVEQHLNSTSPPKAGQKPAQYSMAIVAENASPKSVAWARSYTRLVASLLGIPDRGVVKYSGRGAYNVALTTCPAILLEPGFISDPAFARVAATGEVLEAMAQALVDSIREHFDGGLIGLSVGHGYRDKPDPGALVPREALVEPEWDTETELNDAIISLAESKLLEIGKDQ